MFFLKIYRKKLYIFIKKFKPFKYIHLAPSRPYPQFRKTDINYMTLKYILTFLFFNLYLQ